MHIKTKSRPRFSFQLLKKDKFKLERKKIWINHYFGNPFIIFAESPHRALFRFNKIGKISSIYTLNRAYQIKKTLFTESSFSPPRLQSSAEHVRFCFLTPYCRSMLINLQGSGGQVWTETASRKPATTNAGEHLLSVRHTKLSPRSPSPPSGAWETAQSQGQPPNAEWTQRQSLSVEGELPNCSLKYSYLHTVPTHLFTTNILFKFGSKIKKKKKTFKLCVELLLWIDFDIWFELIFEKIKVKIL